MHKHLVVASAIGGLMLASMMTVAAQAQAPSKIKQYNAWGAYTHSGSAGKICYVLSVPTEKQPADRDHHPAIRSERRSQDHS